MHVGVGQKTAALNQPEAFILRKFRINCVQENNVAIFASRRHEMVLYKRVANTLARMLVR